MENMNKPEKVKTTKKTVKQFDLTWHVHDVTVRIDGSGEEEIDLDSLEDYLNERGVVATSELDDDSVLVILDLAESHHCLAHCLKYIQDGALHVFAGIKSQALEDARLIDQIEPEFRIHEAYRSRWVCDCIMQETMSDLVDTVLKVRHTNKMMENFTGSLIGALGGQRDSEDGGACLKDMEPEGGTQ